MSEQPTFKKCKFCQQLFPQIEIYNHQRCCNLKNAQSYVKLIEIQDQSQKQELQQNENQGSFTDNMINYDKTIVFQVQEKFKDKISIKSVKKIQSEPKENPYQQQQSLISNKSQQKDYENQQEKCDHCNHFVNLNDWEKHQLECSSVIRFNNLLKEFNEEQCKSTFIENQSQKSNQNSKNEIIQNQNCVVSQNNNQKEPIAQFYQNGLSNQQNAWQQVQHVSLQKQPLTQNQIISQYLQIIQQHKPIIEKAKRLLNQASINSVFYKNTFSQKKCLICQEKFKEEKIYSMQCCFSKYHLKCLLQYMTKSIKCHSCKMEIFSSIQQLNL